MLSANPAPSEIRGGLRPAPKMPRTLANSESIPWSALLRIESIRTEQEPGFRIERDRRERLGRGGGGRGVLLIIGVAAVALGPLLLTPIPTSRRETSPDGEFTAVVSTALIHSLIPVMPGHGTDTH